MWDWIRIKFEKFQMAIAWALPRWLVKWCFVRVVAHATTGQYGDTVLPSITAMESLKRWCNDGKPTPSH